MIRTCGFVVLCGLFIVGCDDRAEKKVEAEARLARQAQRRAERQAQEDIAKLERQVQSLKQAKASRQQATDAKIKREAISVVNAYLAKLSACQYRMVNGRLILVPGCDFGNDLWHSPYSDASLSSEGKDNRFRVESWKITDTLGDSTVNSLVIVTVKVRHYQGGDIQTYSFWTSRDRGKQRISSWVRQ